MDKSNKNIIIGVILGAAALIAVLLLMGVNLGPLSTGSQADLRLVFQPYMAASDIKDICINSNAQWHEDKDYIGCVGLGPTSCDSPIVLSAQTQCLAVGADYFCETGVQGYTYCKY